MELTKTERDPKLNNFFEISASISFVIQLKDKPINKISILHTKKYIIFKIFVNNQVILE